MVKPPAGSHTIVNLAMMLRFSMIAIVISPIWGKKERC